MTVKQDKKERQKKQKTVEEQDKVLRVVVTVVIVLLIIVAIIITVRVLNPRADIEVGTKLLKEMEKDDVSKVDAQIIEMERVERETDEAWQNRTYNEKFANSMILGDSIAQGLYEFEIIDAALVAATKGADVSNPDMGSREDLQKAVSVKPQNVFLTYGMNDLEATNANAESFKEFYRTYLGEIKEALPDAKIYVNSILPTASSAIDNYQGYNSVPEFNEQLRILCVEENVTFIDQTENAKEEYYESDGIHFKPEFYSIWLNSMVEASGI